MKLLALTDHDTVDGVPEALDAARVKNIELIARGRALLGPRRRTRTCTSSATALDHTDSTLLATLEDFRADRVRRIHAMADNLRELGFTIDDAHLTTPRPAARTSPTRCSRRQPDGWARATRSSPPTSSRARRPTCARSRPTVARGDRRHPRRRRPRGLGAPVLGRRAGRARRCASSRPRARRRRGLLRHPHRGADPPAARARAASCGLITTGSTDFHGPEHPHFNQLPGVLPARSEPHLGRGSAGSTDTCPTTPSPRWSPTSRATASTRTSSVKLADLDTADTDDIDREEARRELETLTERIAELQARLYAEEERGGAGRPAGHRRRRQGLDGQARLQRLEPAGRARLHVQGADRRRRPRTTSSGATTPTRRRSG